MIHIIVLVCEIHETEVILISTMFIIALSMIQQCFIEIVNVSKCFCFDSNSIQKLIDANASLMRSFINIRIFRNNFSKSFTSRLFNLRVDLYLNCIVSNFLFSQSEQDLLSF